MDSIENQEIIKKYIEDTLNASEKQAFEQALATDTALQKEVEVYRALHFITRNRELMVASQTIGAVIGKTTLEPDFNAYQDYLKPPSVKWWKKKWFWGLGTLVVLLVAIIGLYQSKKTAEQARNEAFVQQFEPFENIIGHDSTDILPFAIAMRLYDKKDFQAAKAILKTDVKRTNDATEQLYLGITQRLTNENEAAIITLRALVQNQDEFTQEPARYNLALALLKVGKRQEAADILRGLIGHPIYGGNVQKIMNYAN